MKNILQLTIGILGFSAFISFPAAARDPQMVESSQTSCDRASGQAEELRRTELSDSGNEQTVYPAPVNSLPDEEEELRRTQLSDSGNEQIVYPAPINSLPDEERLERTELSDSGNEQTVYAAPTNSLAGEGCE